MRALLVIALLLSASTTHAGSGEASGWFSCFNTDAIGDLSKRRGAAYENAKAVMVGTHRGQLTINSRGRVTGCLIEGHMANECEALKSRVEWSDGVSLMFKTRKLGEMVCRQEEYPADNVLQNAGIERKS